MSLTKGEPAEVLGSTADRQGPIRCPFQYHVHMATDAQHWAAHESGHALVGYLKGITPVGYGLGGPEQPMVQTQEITWTASDPFKATKLEAFLMTCVAGAAAEVVLLGHFLVDQKTQDIVLIPNQDAGRFWWAKYQDQALYPKDLNSKEKMRKHHQHIKHNLNKPAFDAAWDQAISDCVAFLQQPAHFNGLQALNALAVPVMDGTREIPIVLDEIRDTLMPLGLQPRLF